MAHLRLRADHRQIHPVTGQHSYDTGNLYRTVHWKEEQFGLNGYFTDSLTDSPTRWLNHALEHKFTQSPTELLTDSPTQPLPHRPADLLRRVGSLID